MMKSICKMIDVLTFVVLLIFFLISVNIVVIITVCQTENVFINSNLIFCAFHAGFYTGDHFNCPL